LFICVYAETMTGFGGIILSPSVPVLVIPVPLLV